MASNTNDDLLFEEDLVGDFLEGDNLESSSSKDAKSATPSENSTKNSEDKKNNPSEDGESVVSESSESEDGDAGDWIESAKVDLPGQLALDIYETKDNLIVLCRIAGVDEKNIDVSISADNILNIRGTLVAQKTEENVKNYFIQECYWGEFSRSVSLPVDIKKENINATLENGILQIIFTKIKQHSVKKINIKTNKS